jgi:WD40 repeat protein
MDTTIRIWDITSGRMDAMLSSVNQGHSSAVCCLKHIPAFPPTNQQYVASGGCDGTVKIWSMAGVHVFTISLGDGVFVTALEVFADQLGGHPMMIAGLSDGRLVVISCRSMSIILVIDAVICSSLAVNSIAVLGGSRFLTAGDDGQLIVWQVEKALLDSTS